MAAQTHLSRSPEALGRVLDGPLDCDIVIVDAPPSMGALTALALVAGDRLVSPFVPSLADLASVGPFLAEVKKLGKLAPRLVGLVPSMVRKTKGAEACIEEAERSHPGKVTRARVPLSASIVEAGLAGSPVAVYAPSSSAAIALDELAKELEG
jgi:chromosome partitioning protein